MVKNTKIDAGIATPGTRLQAIAEMKFAQLSDDVILSLLAERKQLQEEQYTYEKRLKEEEERLAFEKKNAAKRAAVVSKQESLMQAIEKLNLAISPDKPNVDLLVLIQQRQTLEKELEMVQEELKQLTPPLTAVPIADALKAEGLREPEKTPAPAAESPEKLENLEQAPAPQAAQHEEIKKEVSVSLQENTSPEPNFKQSLKEEFGSEGIQADELGTDSKLRSYLDQLKSNTGSLGRLLQEMPVEARKNKAFMLKVAEIDAAYAMHYADPDTLKKDEDFNIRIAQLPNPRHSGNALAEMLPEARTSAVVLAGVKQDYRNIRFAQPQMAAYDEMMRIAKQMALEKVKDLKHAADIALLIPRPLQQDKSFMAEVEKIIATTQENNNGH